MIFGPTASGKTDFLLNLRNISEIISIDSLQIYRYMDIGTAKPEKAVTDKIKHHLIDIIDPDVEFSTWDLVKSADILCRDIYSRGLIPVVSGGNAFTLRNFIYGLPQTPGVDLKIRDEINTRIEKEGLETLSAELKYKDPSYFSKISCNDRYRIARGLEIIYSAGKPVSSFQISEKHRNEYDFLLIGLNRERVELYDRINKRVDKMFDDGLAEEIEKLKKMGYKAGDPGMCGIGYREFFTETRHPQDIEKLKELIKKNTRHYAKRQITFFKKIENVIWENPENSSVLLKKIEQFLSACNKNL